MILRHISALALAGFLGACGQVQLGGNELDRNLPPAQAKVCREAVANALYDRGISPQAVKNIDYQVIDEGSHASSTRLRGFQAWVYPLSGGAWLVELSTSCQVRDVRMLRDS